MRSGKKSIQTPISPIVIADNKSYWATHFYSILKCMDSHKNLQHSPRRFQEFPFWSLSLLRGNLPPNFFDQVEVYIRNWGVQYFFASLFNQKIGSHIIIELIERLEELYGVCFNKSLDQFSFYVSGNDSSLSYKLSNRFTEVFPFKNMKGSLSELIGYSDLCLVLDNTLTGSSVGIFGEVEGTYGNKLRTENYWGKKQEFCVFGVGVVEGDQKLIYFEESHHKGIPRVNLMFEKSHFFISDFLEVLNCFKFLFLYGPTIKYRCPDDEFGFFLTEIKKMWSTPIEQVFVFLERFIDGDDLVGYNDGSISIITDLQS
ncbi:hypothetical protein CWB58_18720 [Pseudoalteromonas sp. S201]|uniref:hypothetical protein n=1 Tax=unclassified Pseudoalteromonas TaxID=194690 RepID=UPI0003F4C872|nr:MULTISPECIES: hypothetical protein [unclassified Pseudoalteromonas]TMS91584.1 hypothetical protein CWB58_18720 [Pseudoalteromonas sp. S201]